jgi:hypothetical protein
MAFNQGGGIFMCDWGGLDIFRVKIINNRANNHGGGIFNNQDNYSLTNVLLANNFAFQGGSLYAAAGIGEMRNITASNNQDVMSDMQTISSPNSPLTIFNSIIYNNTGTPAIPMSPIIYLNSLIENISVFGPPNNNLDGWLDPMFVNPANDYQLSLGSPCIDMGDNRYYWHPMQIDLAGNPRIQSMNIDLGAYENPGYSPAPPQNAPNNNEEQQAQPPIAEASFDWNLQLYPNPTTGELRIKNEELSERNIEILDVLGRILLSQKSLPSQETTINVSHLANGMYFLKLTTADGSQKVKKFVKQ